MYKLDVRKRALLLARGGYFTLVLISLLFGVQALANPLLWKVEDPTSGAQLHLFGAIHFGRDAMYPLPAEVEQAYSSATALVVEVNLIGMAPADMSAILQRDGQNPPGVLLQGLVGADVWAQLEQVSIEQGLDLQAFQPMKPWLTAMQLATMQMRTSGFSDALGIDRYFLERASVADSGKTIIELESLQSQLAIFSDLSIKDQTHFLQQALEEFELGSVYLTEIADAWSQGNESSLQALISGTFKVLPGAAADSATVKMYQAIFTDRNAEMAARVVELLGRGESAFVVVGVGHLIGGTGIVQLLVDQGYKVTSVAPLHHKAAGIEAAEMSNNSAGNSNLPMN